MKGRQYVVLTVFQFDCPVHWFCLLDVKPKQGSLAGGSESFMTEYFRVREAVGV